MGYPPVYAGTYTGPNQYLGAVPEPFWQPGQILNAADVNSWMVPLTAYKLIATARTSTTTQTADPDLAIGLPQNGTWIIEAQACFNGPASNSLAWGWQTSSSSISGQVAQLYLNNSGALTLERQNWTTSTGRAQTVGAGGGSNERMIRFNGLVTVGSAGTLALAWAQGTSSGTATTMDVCSFILAWRAN